MRSNKRHTYLIDPKFQLSFVAYNVGASFVVSGVFYAAIRFFFWKLKAFGVAAGLAPDNVFFVFITEQTSLMTAIFFVSSAVIALILTVHGIFLSHKIAGPLYHLRRHMLEVARGEREDAVHFRKNDYFKDLEDAYNRQMESRKSSGKSHSQGAG